MRHVISLLVLACALANPAFAQLQDKPVPMDKAPFHIPVFSNDYIVLLNVNIPPGRNTGYHIHYSARAQHRLPHPLCRLSVGEFDAGLTNKPDLWLVRSERAGYGWRR